MLLAARFILGASLLRTESRLSHFREPPAARRRNWLVWIDVLPGGASPSSPRRRFRPRCARS